MDFDEVLNNRRSVRLYKNKIVERIKIYKIIQAGILAPSAGNLQSWNFILVDDTEVKNQIVTAAMQQDWMFNSQIIVICSNPENTKKFYGLRGEALYTVQDCAAAIENMLLEATNLGLGSCWIGAFDEKAISRILKLPDNIRPQAIITIGYSDETPAMPRRYNLNSLIVIILVYFAILSFNLFGSADIGFRSPAQPPILSALLKFILLATVILSVLGWLVLAYYKRLNNERPS